MRGFFHELVTKLVADDRPLSRNRHFDSFDDPAGRRALHVSRHLRALERDLLAPDRGGRSISVAREERQGAVVFRLELSRLRARRVAYLSRAELAILLERPGIREALGEALEPL